MLLHFSPFFSLSFDHFFSSSNDRRRLHLRPFIKMGSKYYALIAHSSPIDILLLSNIITQKNTALSSLSW